MTDFKRGLHESKGSPGTFSVNGWEFKPLDDPGWYEVRYQGVWQTYEPTLTAAKRWAIENWRRIEREYLG